LQGRFLNFQEPCTPAPSFRETPSRQLFASHHLRDRVFRGKGSYWAEVTSSMQHNDSRLSYLLMGLIEESELRQLLDEVYFHAL
jgi:hypothetical protein